jgi:sugar phosphate isomerase/epimerase
MIYQSRRNFIQLTGLSLAAIPLIGLSNPLKGKKTLPSINALTEKLSLGLASYTTRNFTLTQTIEVTKRLDLKKITLKDIHLPLKSTNEEITKAVAEIKAAGIDLYGVGVVYMTSEEEVNHAFEYAKAAGVKMIIGVPEHKFLPLAEQKVKEYNIALAIHNHGPEDRRFPSPQSVYEKINKLDSRIGMCLDIGHTMRLGIDPSDPLEKYFERIMDIHIKDESLAGPKGTTVEIGRGVINIPKFIKTLIRLNYKGNVAFEFEKDEENPLPGLSESVGFIQGILSVI